MSWLNLSSWLWSKPVEPVMAPQSCVSPLPREVLHELSQKLKDAEIDKWSEGSLSDEKIIKFLRKRQRGITLHKNMQQKARAIKDFYMLCLLHKNFVDKHLIFKSLLIDQLDILQEQDESFVAFAKFYLPLFQ
jgi:hypothetical protein